MDGIETPLDRWRNTRAAYGPIRTEVRPEHLARVLAARSVRSNPRLVVRHDVPAPQPSLWKRVFG